MVMEDLAQVRLLSNQSEGDTYIEVEYRVEVGVGVQTAI